MDGGSTIILCFPYHQSNRSQKVLGMIKDTSGKPTD
jgi:hypothetical protein